MYTSYIKLPSQRKEKMKTLVLFIGAAFSCSNESAGQCGCPPDFDNATTSYGDLCWKKHSNSMLYTDAREVCEGVDAAFPVIDSDAVLSVLDGLDNGSTWIQAIKSGPVVNFNRWQDWNGKTLRGVGWYKDEEEEEYEVTYYAYLKESMIMSASAEEKKPFICLTTPRC